MTVRRRILFAALVVGAVGTLVVLVWASEPKDAAPKLSITVCGYKKGGENIAFVAVTNTEACPVAVGIFQIEVRGVTNKIFAQAKPRRAILQGGGWTNIWLEFRLKPDDPEEAKPLRIFCCAERQTRYNKLLERIHVLPVVGSHIDGPHVYHIESQPLD